MSKGKALGFLIVTTILLIVGIVLIVLDYKDGVTITYHNYLPIVTLLISGGMFLNSCLKSNK